MVTILMTYVSGIQDMLEIAVNALYRYEARYPWILRIVTDENDPQAKKEALWFKDEAEIVSYNVGKAKSGSGQHGRLLDKAVQDVKSHYFLTMDSDCFPVKHGWLEALVDLQSDTVVATGIRWPWIPPLDLIDKNNIEWRIRKYHNWNNLQPACQLVRTELMLDTGWKFADPDGDDTNHGFMEKLHAAGLKTAGWLPTRGPLPDTDFDPEMNRHESLIYGDMVYHHVGATRESHGETNSGSVIFKTARDRVYNEQGAEWMLKPGNSHVFRMDVEEDVAQFKMRMLYQTAILFLKNNDCLFSRDWA